MKFKDIWALVNRVKQKMAKEGVEDSALEKNLASLEMKIARLMTLYTRGTIYKDTIEKQMPPNLDAHINNMP